MKNLSQALKTIYITCIAVNGLMVILTVLFTAFSGIVFASFFRSDEPGWGILGIGTTLLGAVLLAYLVPRLTGYILLLKKKKAGLIPVIVMEALGTVFKIWLLIQDFSVFILLTAVWSAGICVLLAVTAGDAVSGKES
jgi:hypothetical protein